MRERHSLSDSQGAQMVMKVAFTVQSLQGLVCEEGVRSYLTWYCWQCHHSGIAGAAKVTGEMACAWVVNLFKVPSTT